MSSYNSYISYPALLWAEAALGGAGSGQGVTPYEYAVQCGYTGTEEEFKVAYMRAIDPPKIIDGGIADSTSHSVIDGGIGASMPE